jgi:hypothetical protein
MKFAMEADAPQVLGTLAAIRSPLVENDEIARRSLQQAASSVPG